MSVRLRQAWLGVLRRCGRKSFVTTSGLGHRFLCHIGDFLGESPYYNRDVFRVELEVCAAWLRGEDNPMVFDVGANVGFWSTHLAQMIATKSPQIYAFEPVAPTLSKLVESVERLDLVSTVRPVAAAVLDVPRSVRLSYSPRDSLFAQVSNHGLNSRVGERLVHAAGTTLDEFTSSLDLMPTFVKIDVEGSELAVLQGARRLLACENSPALMLEYNPTTLAEAGASAAALQELLEGYMLRYIDDFEGQRRPIGDVITSLAELSWVCNILAIPEKPGMEARCLTAFEAARTRCPTEARKPNLLKRLAVALHGRR